MREDIMRGEMESKRDDSGCVIELKIGSIVEALF